MTPHPVLGVEVLAIEAGTAALHANDDAARVITGPFTGTPTAAARLAPGGEAVLRGSEEANCWSAGPAPASVLLVVIAPASPESASRHPDAARLWHTAGIDRASGLRRPPSCQTPRRRRLRRREAAAQPRTQPLIAIVAAWPGPLHGG